MSSLARAGPARSASRCGPPIDGVSPTTISTSPNFARSLATRMSQASAISKAAVRQRPCAAKTVGSGSSSIVWMSRQQLVPQRAAAIGAMPSKTLRRRRRRRRPCPPPGSAGRAAGRRRPRRSRRAAPSKTALVEEVQRRAVERQDGQRALLLQADDVASRVVLLQLPAGRLDARPCRPVRGSRAGAEGRPRSAGSRAGGSERRSATRRRRSC